MFCGTLKVFYKRLITQAFPCFARNVGNDEQNNIFGVCTLENKKVQLIQCHPLILWYILKSFNDLKLV